MNKTKHSNHLNAVHKKPPLNIGSLKVEKMPELKVWPCVSFPGPKEVAPPVLSHYLQLWNLDSCLKIVKSK